MPVFLKFDGVDGNVSQAQGGSSHVGGANFLLGDGSVRFASDDSFDFTAATKEDAIALLLPAVQAARETARSTSRDGEDDGDFVLMGLTGDQKASPAPENAFFVRNDGSTMTPAEGEPPSSIGDALDFF